MKIELDSIAVGTALSGGPPRRSQRAALPHWAPALGSGVEAFAWEGVHHSGRREPPSCDAVHPGPVETVSLAAAPERLEPEPSHLNRSSIAGDSIPWKRGWSNGRQEEGVTTDPVSR